MTNQEIVINKKSCCIGWWNTHLTPPKGNALPIGEKSLVLETILLLLGKCHIVCLGEVSSADLYWLEVELKGTPFVVKDFTQSMSKNKFNLGLIYNEQMVKFVGHEYNIPEIAGNNYKVSCRLDFLIHDEDYFTLIASHWPSRLFKGEDSETRGHFGSALRTVVENLLNSGSKYLVVLGDFNDEPYNHSMTKYLRGCRDAAFVNRNPKLLYNPFWKQITCQTGYAKLPDLTQPTGTYFYKGDNLHRWRVFDQMLFCSSFVGNSDWHLNEKETGVFRHEALVAAVESSNSKLDHLPIYAEVQKEEVNG